MTEAQSFAYDTLSAIVYMKCPFEVNFQVPYFT